MFSATMSQGVSNEPRWDPDEPEATQVAASLRAQISAAKAKARAYREGLEAAGKLTPREDDPARG